MHRFKAFSAVTVVALTLSANVRAEELHVPRFSVKNMDRSVDPSVDFYRYAAGAWLTNNPVPADKSRWSGFEELQERNWKLIRNILEQSATERSSSRTSPSAQVGTFFTSAMDTNRIEKLGFKPIRDDLKRIDRLKSTPEVMALVADFHLRGIGALFGAGVSPDAKNSSVYAFRLGQGGLGLPDRDYYLKDEFAEQREAYVAHIAKMFQLLGAKTASAEADAKKVLEIETALAKSSRTRVQLRDPKANYHKIRTTDFAATNRSSAWPRYLDGNGLETVPDLIVGQPEFFHALDTALKTRPLDDWKVYLRWHLVSSTAPYLHRAAEQESFAFYGTKLRGQPQQEPRWQRAARVVDGSIGEALGQIYVTKHYPPKARARMDELIVNLREVFRDRLKKLDWMSDETRTLGLAKFERFTEKVGHPETFRDYSKITLKRTDYLGNIQRSARFESLRRLARVGGPVNKTEWHMTPQTVNAYFNPLQNEIVFPAGILQPPFFDVEADDAVNYAAIGAVIGHEITHGYDDSGRQYDADGNLKDWWTEQDAKEFDVRAQKVVKQYDGYQALPGLHVNGKFTLGENIADLGGASLAFEALQRALAKDPTKRKKIDDLTPEQRFFISWAQVWRTNWREAELRRRITVDPHSPGQFRAVGPHVNMQEFYDAFNIKEGAPMWRPVNERARIW